MAAPAGGHGPAAGAAVRGLGRGRPFLAAVRGCGWNSLAVRSLALRLRPDSGRSGLGVKIGGVLRGVLPRSSALRASGGGARVIITAVNWWFIGGYLAKIPDPNNRDPSIFYPKYGISTHKPSGTI